MVDVNFCRPYIEPCQRCWSTRSLNLGFPSDPVHSRKSQNQFRHLGLLDPGFDPRGPILRKVPAEHTSYVEKRATPADQAYIVGAVTDNVTFSTQHGILQRNRIENPAPFSSAFHL
jgi:hypothetical protein